MVYVHKDSACLFILNYYQNLYIKKTVHVQINSQNISIKKNVPCILLRFKKMFYILQTNIVKIQHRSQMRATYVTLNRLSCHI